MKCRHRLLAISLLLALFGGCGDESSGADASFARQPPPADKGIHGYANGCYAVEVFDGSKTLRYIRADSSGDRFSLADDKPKTASRFHMRATDLGSFVLYDTERRYFTAVASKTGSAWHFSRPDQLESEVDRLEDGFISPAEWRLELSPRDTERYQLQHLATGRFLTLSGLTDDASKAAIVTLQPRDGCATFPELSIDANGAVKPRKWDDGDVYGIAEIHSHMMADSGFGGGGIFHGAPFHRLGVERALPDCSRSHGLEGRRDLLGSFHDGDSDFDLKALLPVLMNGEFEVFSHHTAGYPKFTEWPNSWRRSTHQTMYYRWLERAHLAGLRLLVQHATGNSVMCDLTLATTAQKTLYSCNDMVSVDRAIDQVHALERYIDAQAGGPGKGWLRVVNSPKAARDVINEGKLAVILGIEISNLFDCFLTPPKGFEKCTAQTVRGKLDHYRGKGVSVIFPVHKFDNGFSAGDGSSGIIELGNIINSGHYSNLVKDCPGPSTAFDGSKVTFGGLNKPREVYDSPAPLDFSGMVDDLLATFAPHLNSFSEPGLSGKYCQKHGLTPLGKTLMHELMARGMLIDVAHLPQHALGEAYALLEKADYPAMKTHGNSNGGRIYALGGLVGTRLGRCGDPKKPAKMGKSLAAHVAEAKSKGAYPAEALSFDLNGLAGGPRPRFGPDKGCSAPQANPITYPFASYDGEVTFTQPHLGEREVDFNNEGMLHIGLLPEVIEDARRDGVTDKALEPLFRSAEAYLRMWEKAQTRAKLLKR